MGGLLADHIYRAASGPEGIQSEPAAWFNKMGKHLLCSLYNPGCSNTLTPLGLDAHTKKKHPKETTYSDAFYLVLLLVLQDGLEEDAALVARGLLVKHAGLDHLLVHVQFVLGGRQDLFLHAVHGAEAEHAHFVHLADAVGAVLSLEVLGSTQERDMWDAFWWVQRDTQGPTVTPADWFKQWILDWRTDLFAVERSCSINLCFAFLSSDSPKDIKERRIRFHHI